MSPSVTILVNVNFLVAIIDRQSNSMEIFFAKELSPYLINFLKGKIKPKILEFSHDSKIDEINININKKN